MSIILDIKNIKVSDFISEADILFQADFEVWENQVFEEYQNYLKYNPSFDLFEFRRFEPKATLSKINATNQTFDKFPAKFKSHLIRKIERETGLTFNHVTSLKNPYYEPQKLGFWSDKERDVENFAEYKRTVLMLELFKSLSMLNSIDPIALQRLDFSDEKINETAELMANTCLQFRQPTLRQVCPKHWRRKIRREINDTTEWVSNIFALADKKHPFVSKQTLSRYHQLWVRNDEYLKSHFIKNDLGDIVNLREVVKSKSSSRNSMMYSVTLGMSQKAQKLAYTPCFYTLTLPPQFHPNSGKYNPAISAVAQRQEMQTRWHRVLAMAAKSKLKFFGLHTTEAHKDGTPHRHCLIYVNPDDLEQFNECLRYHFPETLENSWRKIENGVAVNLKVLNDYKGAVFYVNKYIQKSISFDEDYDFGVKDEKDEDQLAHFDHHKAWSSSRRIRRYGFIGMRSIIGKWELIYKQKEPPQGPFFHVWQAMQQGKWCEVLEMLGAFGEHLKFSFRNVFEERMNSYEEVYTVPSLLVGEDKETGERFMLDYRPVIWEIVKINNLTDDVVHNFVTSVALIESYPSPAREARLGACA